MNLLLLTPTLVPISLVTAAALAAWLQRFAPRAAERERKDCASAGWLLSAAERSLFTGLQAAVGDRFALFAKVRLADVIRPADGSARLRGASELSVGFVACDPRTMRIVGVIELVERETTPAHGRRAQTVAALLAAARIPLLQVEAQRTYCAETLAAQVETAFSHHPPAAAPAAEVEPEHAVFAGELAIC